MASLTTSVLAGDATNANAAVARGPPQPSPRPELSPLSHPPPPLLRPPSPAPITPSLLLGRMLIDRTSFDETDSFGVDALALESSSYRDALVGGGVGGDPNAGGGYSGGGGIVMRNGKVRRRLKWRPKSMMKQRRTRAATTAAGLSDLWNSNSRVETGGIPGSVRQLPQDHLEPNPPQNHSRRRGRAATPSSSSGVPSSNASVTTTASSSNASEASKQSKRSLHSFSSVETLVKSNTSRSRLARGGGAGSSGGQPRRFPPLPRSNYPSALDGIPQTQDATSASSSSTASSSSSGSTQGTASTTTATTISNEGQVLMLQSCAAFGSSATTASGTLRASPSTTTTVFEAADCILRDNDDEEEEKIKDFGEAEEQTRLPPHLPKGPSSSSASNSTPPWSSRRGVPSSTSFPLAAKTLSSRPPLSKSRSATTAAVAAAVTITTTTRATIGSGILRTSPPPLHSTLSRSRSGSKGTSSPPEPVTSSSSASQKTTILPRKPQSDPSGLKAMALIPAIGTTPAALFPTEDAGPSSLPTLSGEELERERRVDLRIRKSKPQHQSATTPKAMLEPMKGLFFPLSRTNSARSSRSGSSSLSKTRTESKNDTSSAGEAIAPSFEGLSIAELRSGDEGQDPDNGKDPSGRREAALDDYDEDEELEGTAIEVGEDAEPEVVTEQRNPSPYPSPSTWAAQSSASLGIPHSSSVRSGSWGRRMVDPVIGPSFGTRVRERHDPDAESIKQQNNNVNHVLKSSLRSTPLTGDPSFTLDAPIPEIRFPVEDSLHWNYSQQQPRDNTASEDRPSSSTLPATPRTHPTVPVDLDDCSFLEAEKNLQAIHDMATEHLQQGEYDEALEVFEEILRGQLTRHGTNHPRVGTALHNLGVVHMRREDYALAVQAYREAVAVRRSALYPNHPDVASSLAQLGVAYLERRMHKKAIAAFRESLKIRRKCLGSSHPKVAKILNNIGCALYELNALDVAQVAFEEALVIQRSCLRREPAHNQAKSNFLLLSIASTLCNVASIKLYFGDADAASVDFQEALLIQQCVFGDDHPTPLQTEESLRWIESVRVPPPYHRRPSVPSDTGADAHSGATFGIFSRMFRRSSVSGFAMAEQGNDPALVNVNCETSSSVHPGLLACAVRGDDAARDVLGTVEERLKRLQDQIELACGPPASESFLFEYDDDESESDDEEVRVDEEYGDNFDNELSRIRRAVDV